MKKTSLLFTLVFGLSLTTALLWLLGSQNPPAAAAQLASSSAGDWDGLSAGTSTVISSTGKYRMWYQGRGLSFYNQFSLGYAKSLNGLTWDKSSSNPVLIPGDPGEWDSFYRGQVAVIEEGGVYKMWYSGGASSGPWQTGYATSANGIDWVIYSQNPVLQAGGPGSWDEQEADGITVIKDGATYKMWYHGCDLACTDSNIGYATSSDGIHWNKHTSNPVLESTPGTWDESGLGWPRVIKNGATYHMWFFSDGKLGYATSSDGVVWTKHPGNPVMSIGWDGATVGVGSVLLEGNTYKMWLTSGSSALGTRGIGYAKSTDGIHWTQPASNPLLVRGEAGVIINPSLWSSHVSALTLPNTAITITVSGPGGPKATISGLTTNMGWFRSWDNEEDWTPSRPDILPGDTVSATAGVYAAVSIPLERSMYRHTTIPTGLRALSMPPGLAPLR